MRLNKNFATILINLFHFGFKKKSENSAIGLLSNALKTKDLFPELLFFIKKHSAIFIRGTSRLVSHNINNKTTQYMYFGLSGHHQELHETVHETPDDGLIS